MNFLMERSETSRLYLIYLIYLVVFILRINVILANKNLTLVFNKQSRLDENTFIEETLFPENDFRCGAVVNLTTKYGFIKNLDYPNSYKVPIFCQWNIFGRDPDEIITISIDDLDIGISNEHSRYCERTINLERCCKENNLKIRSSNGYERIFCGKSSKIAQNVYISDSNSITITFNATTNRNKSTGFYLSYSITPKFSRMCFQNEFRCYNGKCIPEKWICNTKNECGDGSDELCSSGYVKCGNDNSEYYHISKKCDNHNDCSNMADELDCKCGKNQFACLSSNKCINNSRVCNGIGDCSDFSDETNCIQHCPPQHVRCGSSSHCYDYKLHHCNKILDCPNGADEYNCFKPCHGKIMCASGIGCYDLEERCNGIVQCADYSDEKNCTLELCHPDKGSFLCTNGRCIPSISTCDRSADCYDGSDEMRCLKNSVITAAIIGSLICGLLIVIAISCGCKLVALRQLEQYRNSITNVSNAEPFRNVEFSFPNPGDLDASLYRLEHSVMFREPPPSYATAMGGYYDVNVNNSYVDQYRRFRRQRRCRRILRRQHRNGQPNSNGSNNNQSVNLTINNIESIDAREDATSSINLNTNNNPSNEPLESIDFKNDGKKESNNNKDLMNTNQRITLDNTNISNSNHHRSSHYAYQHHRHYSHNHNHNVATNDNHNIELEPIPPPLTNFDCDSQPLIR